MTAMDPSSRYPMMHPIPSEEIEEEDWQFYAEAIQAWRAWRVVDFDGVLVLQSITYRVNWIPRQEFRAECIPKNPAMPHTVHAAPDLEHGCGIYSLKNFDDVKPWVRNVAPENTAAYGRVSIWGCCFNFTKGYLSELAYPSRIIIPSNKQKRDHKPKLIDASAEEIAIELAKSYRVEVEAEVKKNDTSNLKKD